MPAENCKHGNSAPKDVLEDLPDSQAGSGRHKCAVCAYNEGVNAGIAEGIRRAQHVINELQRKL